ncbi:MAG: DUF5074 domain-containing protein [Bacteroidota bacterium]
MNLNFWHSFNFWALFLFTSIIFISCGDDEDPTPSPPAQDGYFIVNEGGFGNANTSLSYYDRQKDSVLNNVFSNTNNRPLGDQTQSMAVFDDRGFIVVQNSAKIEVIDRETFESLATIGVDEGIISPRYFLGISPTKGYVTDWGADGVSGTVKVLDLENYEVTSSIPVGAGPNELILANNQVYVANGGGFGSDSTVVVIDPQTDTIIEEIVVGDNPSSLTVDTNGNIWVVGVGKLVYDPVDFSVVETESTPGFIARLENDEVAFTLPAAQINTGPASIRVNPAGQQLYFRYQGDIHQMGITDIALPTNPLIDESFYGLAVDPISGEILTGKAPNFSSVGSFTRYSPSGDLIRSYTVGIAPNGFAF